MKPDWMKLYWITVMAVGLTATNAGAQSGAPAMTGGIMTGETDAAANPLHSGVELVVELTKSLQAKKVKPGDTVTARLTQDVILHGRIAVPRESKLIGHVTEAAVRSPEHPDSRLGVVFDKIVMKGGKMKGGTGEAEFHAVVQAIAPPQRRFFLDESGTVESTNDVRSMVRPNGMRMGGTRLSATTTPGAQDGGGNLLPEKAGGETALSGGSHGVIGIKGLALVPASDSASRKGSIADAATDLTFDSTRHDVRLDSGSQLVLRITAPR